MLQLVVSSLLVVFILSPNLIASYDEDFISEPNLTILSLTMIESTEEMASRDRALRTAVLYASAAWELNDTLASGQKYIDQVREEEMELKIVNSTLPKALDGKTWSTSWDRYTVMAKCDRTMAPKHHLNNGMKIDVSGLCRQCLEGLLGDTLRGRDSRNSRAVGGRLRHTVNNYQSGGWLSCMLRFEKYDFDSYSLIY